MGKLFVEAWVKYLKNIDKAPLNRFTWKKRLKIAAFFICYSVGAILVTKGCKQLRAELVVGGVVLLIIGWIGFSSALDKRAEKDPIKRFSYMRNTSAELVPGYLNLLNCSDRELPMILDSVKEYRAIRTKKYNTISNRAFNLCVCGLFVAFFNQAIQQSQKNNPEMASALLVICLLLLAAALLAPIIWIVCDFAYTASLVKTEAVISVLENYRFSEKYSSGVSGDKKSVPPSPPASSVENQYSALA